MSGIALLILITQAAGLPSQAQTGNVTLRAFDGRSLSVELGHISVPADRSRTGNRFVLAYYRLPPKHPANAVPIVFLMGGPGVSATFIAQVPPYFSLFSHLTEVAPVILLDQRGVGLSKPSVDCPSGPKPPPNLFATTKNLLDAYSTAYSACAEYWSSRGVTPDNFSLQEIADDIEDLREALAAPKIDLLGLSFGTRIALEYVRRHSQSVRKMVLQGTLTPDGLVRLPFEMDEFFRQTAAEQKPGAARNGLEPNLEWAFRTVRQALREPMPVSIRNRNGESTAVRLGSDVFAALVATHTTDPRLPALLTSLAHKDTSVIAPMLQAIYQDLEKGAGSMMAHSVVCTATESTNRLPVARAQVPKSLLGEPFDNAMVTDNFCQKIHVSHKTAAAPPPSGDIPVLFINGDLDDRTPLSLAKAAAKGFKRAQLFIVMNGGHELLPEPEIQTLIADYFADRELRNRPIALESRKFLTVEEAARPPRRGP
ncbi:MAG TPA: alpha/beta fold hydrolase [Terriglobales bacterium]|nr:alpha/beta fold hydrolase [Terriglobales bacterium]